jgi:hypothetical protein
LATELRLRSYEGVFREAEIGPDVLLDLTDSDAFQLAGAPEAGLKLGRRSVQPPPCRHPAPMPPEGVCGPLPLNG